MSRWMKISLTGLVLILGINACAQSAGEEEKDDLVPLTVLPRDGIPAIDDPEFLSAEEADEEYEPSELVIGVNYDGDARAYSLPFLSQHEIVNDTVGGRKIAVTW